MQALALDFSALMPMPARAEPEPLPVMKGLRKRVWLLLYTEGGTWTAQEIGKRFPEKSARNMHSMLADMVRDDFLVRRRIQTVDGDTVVKFGVAGNCGIPRGVQLEEIEALLRLAVSASRPWKATL